MTDTSVLHQFNVLVDRLEDANLPEWKKTALLAKAEECHEIISSHDRRATERRGR